VFQPMRKKRRRKIGLPDDSKTRAVVIGSALFFPLPLALIVSSLVKLPPAIGPVPVVIGAIGLVLCVAAIFSQKPRGLRFACGFYLAMTFCIPLALFLYWPREWFVTGILGGQVLGAITWICSQMLVHGNLDPFGNNIRNIGGAEFRKAIWGLAGQFLIWNVLVALIGGTPCTSGGRCKTGEALFGTHEGLFSSYWTCCLFCTLCVAAFPRFAFEFVARARRNQMLGQIKPALKQEGDNTQ